MNEPLPFRPSPRPFPLSLLLMAVFCVALGAMGVLGGAWSFLSGLFSEPQELSAMVDEALRGAESAPIPSEYRHLIESMSADEAFRKRLLDFSGELSRMVPARPLFNLSSFLLSLLSLVAGIGILARRDWARRLCMAFFVVATLAAIGWGYAILPGLVRVLGAYTVLYGGALDPQVEELIRGYWLLVWVSMTALHAGLVVYLMRHKVREVFTA